MRQLDRSLAEKDSKPHNPLTQWVVQRVMRVVKSIKLVYQISRNAEPELPGAG